jgi:uncharacterized membrane protein YeaQ/YmgE (transglycosylase-associated protein family)
MSVIVWILLGLGLGLLASKIVSTTGEGTVVDILLGVFGAIVAGWIFNLFGGTGITGFDMGSLYSIIAGIFGAVVSLRRAVLRSPRLGHAGPVRLSTAVRAHPLRLEGRRRSLLVRRA